MQKRKITRIKRTYFLGRIRGTFNMPERQLRSIRARVHSMKFVKPVKFFVVFNFQLENFKMCHRRRALIPVLVSNQGEPLASLLQSPPLAPATHTQPAVPF